MYHLKYQIYLKIQRLKFLVCNTLKLFETFDNLHNEHCDMLKSDIEQLKDLTYYEKTGLRRKKSYLFYGEPGCGKNASVVAMALHDNRHIIDIPFNVLQYNSEFYELMNLTSIEDVPFKKNQIIIMFDEMHNGLSRICKNELFLQNMAKEKRSEFEEFLKSLEGKDKKSTVSLTHDSLDLGCILSTLDGIGNYGGIIIVGLTNYIDQIPDPLKRSLRLTPIYFTYLRKIDAISLIEKFYNNTLDDDIKQLIPDRKITPAKLRHLCEQNNKPMKEFIDVIIKESENESKGDGLEIDNISKYLLIDDIKHSKLK